MELVQGCRYGILVGVGRLGHLDQELGRRQAGSAHLLGHGVDESWVSELGMVDRLTLMKRPSARG